MDGNSIITQVAQTTTNTTSALLTTKSTSKTTTTTTTSVPSATPLLKSTAIQQQESTVAIVVDHTSDANNNTTNTNGNSSDKSGFRTALTNSPSKKSKRKSLFKSLLCCFPTPNRDNIEKSVHQADNGAATVANSEKHLLPILRQTDSSKNCLIIDLDETLVHSSFKPIPNADFIVPVEIEGVTHQVYVLKRPFVDEFLKRMGELYECVLFTASLAKYADPVADLLDKWGVFRARLFRESCVYYRGNYVKDLNKLGREIKNVIILDNSPASYMFHPDNAVPVNSWFDDMNDRELLDLMPYLEGLSNVEDVYKILAMKLDDKQPQDSFFPLFNDSNTTSINTTTTQQQQNDDSSVITQLQQNHIDHINIKQSITKTTIKRNQHLNNLNESDISLNTNTNSLNDTNNNIVTKSHNNNNNNNNNNTSNNKNLLNLLANTDDSYTINENSIVLSMDMTPNKMLLNKVQREISIEE